MILPSLIAPEREPDTPIVHFLNDRGEWQPVTRGRFWTDVIHAAAGLASLGLDVQQCVGILSENRPEMIMTYFAAFRLRSVAVSMYATSSASQVRFIVDDASIRHIVVGSQLHYELARQAGVPHIITIDPSVTPEPDDHTTITFGRLMELGRTASPELLAALDERMAGATDSETATLIYTSGTTGEPKGAELTHANFDCALLEHVRRFPELKPGLTSMCFLPLSHIFEMAWTCLCLYCGVQVYVNRDPQRIQQSLRETQPNCMCSVPRFWEKVYAGVNEKIASLPAFKRLMMKRALSVGRRRNLDYKRLGLPVPWLLEQSYQFYRRVLFNALRHVIGMEHGMFFPTAGAPIAPEIVDFVRSVGINMIVGYGLSETTATVSCFPHVNYQVGSAGTPLESVQVKIGEQNEIMVKGPTVMKGYYRRPEANAQAFTADGWFHTGDAGYLDSTGAIVITDRIKDLFKTSNGKYIAPQAIEACLGTDRLIEQVAVIGERRKFVSALIVPAMPVLRQIAAEAGIDCSSLTDEQLVAQPQVVALVQERIDRLMAGFAPYERVKRIVLLATPFSMATGELTNTLKLRRAVVSERHAQAIEAMYS